MTIDAKLDEYLADHWEEMVADLDSLVRIPSYREDDKANPEAGAPFGPGPQAALTAALDLAARMGFDTHNLDGHIGYADYAAEEGAPEKQIGIIGHVDVVPAGPGWNVEPYAVTRKEGYLLGRGVIDDKGPVIIALHALKFWADQGVRFPYTVRFLFGAAEETGMEDVPYYQERFEDPDFLFTPDAEFPVCYGEKGHYNGMFTFGPVENAQIVEISAGIAPNAVPGEAEATLLLDENETRLYEEGKNAHASTPELGISALHCIASSINRSHGASHKEQPFIEFLLNAAPCFDGSVYGIDCEDEHFGKLTSVLGLAYTDDQGRHHVTLDVRYPTTITTQQITEACTKYAAQFGVSFEMVDDDVPFLLDPQSPAVQALLSAYNEITGENAQPFTMGGGTYARKFKNAASFGPEKPWVEVPEWVGSMHGPNEGVSEELLKEAFRIYAKVLPQL